MELHRFRPHLKPTNLLLSSELLCNLSPHFICKITRFYNFLTFIKVIQTRGGGKNIRLLMVHTGLTNTWGMLRGTRWSLEAHDILGHSLVRREGWSAELPIPCL
jgi:hypothetical protein